MATSAADARLYRPRTLSEGVFRALLFVAEAALNTAEEKQPLESGLALLEAAIHDLSDAVGRE